MAESNSLVSLKYYYYGFYAQNEMRVTPQLVMNIGLRYEYQTPYNERYSDVAQYDYANSKFIKLGEGVDGLNNPDRNNFAPRLGIAYTLNPKTVIRTGAGVFFGSPRGSEFGSLQLSPPFVIDTTLTSNALVPDLIGRLSLCRSSGQLWPDCLVAEYQRVCPRPEFPTQLHLSVELQHTT